MKKQEVNIKIMETNKIKSINDLGQSIWLDVFDRRIMKK